MLHPVGSLQPLFNEEQLITYIFFKKKIGCSVPFRKIQLPVWVTVFCGTERNNWVEGYKAEIGNQSQISSI
jgi:hypothetical protein